MRKLWTAALVAAVAFGIGVTGSARAQSVSSCGRTGIHTTFAKVLECIAGIHQVKAPFRPSAVNGVSVVGSYSNATPVAISIVASSGDIYAYTVQLTYAGAHQDTSVQSQDIYFVAYPMYYQTTGSYRIFKIASRKRFTFRGLPAVMESGSSRCVASCVGARVRVGAFVLRDFYVVPYDVTILVYARAPRMAAVYAAHLASGVLARS